MRLPYLATRVSSILPALRSLEMEFFGGTGPDPLKPSLFELIAQEQLRDLLQPALKYVLAVRPFYPLEEFLIKV